MAKAKSSKNKDRGRSRSKSDRKGARKEKEKSRKDKGKKGRSRSRSSSVNSSSTDEAALGAEVKLSEAVAASFGVKPKMLKFGKNVAHVADLSPYLLAITLCRSTAYMTENTIMQLGGELYEA